MQQDKINNISSEFNKLILEENLEKIIEMTYSYKEIDDNKFFNITLFEDYAGIEYINDKSINFQNIKEIIDFKLNNNIKFLLNLISTLKQEALGVKGKILYKSLVYTKKILRIVLLGLEFELEKAGYKSNLTQEQKEIKVLEIEEIEEENFGFKIKNNLSEIKLIYDFLFSLFIDTKSHISKKEQIFFLNYINKLNNFLDKEDLVPKKMKKRKEKYDFWNKKISRENYIEIFNFILEKIYNLPQRAIITNASSIYDGEKFLEVPNKDTHKELTIKRVLELIVHEIESHYINSYNNKILLGNFRGARNLEKEEGLAKIMESFLSGDDKNTAVFIPRYMAKILFSELYQGDEFLRFIEIYNKMHTLRRMPTNEFLRQKRNYSLELKGGQHKDISYGRGMIKTLNYLRDGGDFSNLFLGKVGFEDLKNLEELSKSYGDKLMFPIFIGDIISLYLKVNELGKEFILDADQIINFLEDKYNYPGFEKFNLEKNIKEKIKEIGELLEFIDKLELGGKKIY